MRVVWLMPGNNAVPVIHDHREPHVAEAGLTFEKLTHLSMIGLVVFESAQTLGLKQEDKRVNVRYFDAVHHLSGSRVEFEIGEVLFTNVGRELFPISNASGKNVYQEAALAAWKKRGWVERT
jgi:hypothetical protein